MDTAVDRGLYMTTNARVDFYPLDPRPEDINIEDIAIGLSRVPRWCGQSDVQMNVADHSIHVMQLVPESLQLPALLHDAAEAYMQDMPKPMKYSDGMEGYRIIENNIQRVVFESFDCTVTDEEYAVIKHADRRVVRSEAKDLWSPWHEHAHNDDVEFLPYTITPRTNIVARNHFLYLFRKLSA